MQNKKLTPGVNMMYNLFKVYNTECDKIFPKALQGSISLDNHQTILTEQGFDQKQIETAGIYLVMINYFSNPQTTAQMQLFGLAVEKTKDDPTQLEIVYSTLTLLFHSFQTNNQNSTQKVANLLGIELQTILNTYNQYSQEIEQLIAASKNIINFCKVAISHICYEIELPEQKAQDPKEKLAEIAKRCGYDLKTLMEILPSIPEGEEMMWLVGILKEEVEFIRGVIINQELIKQEKQEDLTSFAAYVNNKTEQEKKLEGPGFN